VADVLSNSSPLRRGRPVDRAIAEIAARQHGVISHAQLIALGLSEGQIRYRLQIGRLHRIERGVYAVGHEHLTRESHWTAAVLTYGDRAVLSHRPAGALWTVAPYNGALIDVTAPTDRRSRGRLRAHVGRLDPPDIAIENGIQVTSVARTILDLASIVDVRRVERALERAEKLDLFDLREIEETCRRAHGHRGLKNLRRALALYVPDQLTRSDLERDLRDLCRQHGIEPPRMNAIVAGYEVDAWWPDASLIVELDSWEHHRTRAAFEADRIRDTDLKLAGFEVIRVTWRRLHDAPEQVLESIRRALRNG
jgi:very-short-patch-repair endonuclease/predicted transcriptional regulator of viral defense system